MILGKRTAMAISAVIIGIIVGAFIIAAVINPLPGQMVPKVAFGSKVIAPANAIELNVTHIQLTDDARGQSLQWACFSLSVTFQGNSSGSVDLGDLSWSGNETDWLTIMPGYELGIRSNPGNVSAMRVGDVLCLRAIDGIAAGSWHFSLDYFPPGAESGHADVSVQ